MSCFNKVCQPYRVKLLSNGKTIVLRFAFVIHVVVKRASDEAQEDKGFNFSN